MVYDGLEYCGKDIFDEHDPIHIYEHHAMRVWLREIPTGFRITSFDVNVIETSSDTPFLCYNEDVSRLWLAYVKNRGLFLFRKCAGNQKKIWISMVAVAKIGEHQLFREALCRISGMKFVSLFIEQLDDAKLKFSVFLPTRLVVSDLESLLQNAPKRVIDANVLTFLLRMFNLIDENNFYCFKHGHDDVTGCCVISHEHSQPPQTSQTIQDFFDEVRKEIPPLEQYALRTEKLTARLRPYQRDAARFMIHRELCPNLSLNFGWLFDTIKVLTDEKPLYYLPNLGFFLSNPAVPPTLSTCGGILADEMGLGKTVELLALITTLTPDHTPQIADTNGENTKMDRMDEVREVVVDLISNVVAAVEGERAVTQFKKSKKDTGVLYYSKTSLMPSSPTKKTLIKCDECGTSCVQQRVHWSPGLSTQTRFICPECIMATKELIPIKTTLIVVPNAIAHQWYEEIRKHVKEDFKIDVYKGVSVDGYKHPHYLNQFDIVITTYDVITKEKSFLEVHNPFDRLRKRSYDAAKMACTPLFSVLWWRVCLDESQMIDHSSSMISQMCKGLEARARWSITGTPISTSIKDVYGLVNFLGVSPLDQEWIFDQLYIPYILNHPLTRNRNSLVSFMSKVMWRTEKKHLETSACRVLSHVEMVTLSPMEERMYSDLLTRSKENVLTVVRHIGVDNKLSVLSRHLHSKLLTALSKVQLFLLTSLTGGQKLRKKNDDGNEDYDDNQAMNFNRMFTPESLFRRLLREKKSNVIRSQRDVLMYLNGIAALFWHAGCHQEALQCYSKAVACALKTGPLNEYLGHSNTVVFTSNETNDEKEDNEENDGRIGKPLCCDSLQFVHIYRNVQWLMMTHPELTENSGFDMGLITPLFQQAWRTYSRIEESMFREKESEWEKVNREMSEHCDEISEPLEWIDKLAETADELQKSEGYDWRNLELNIERRVGIKFSNMRVMGGWMKSQLRAVKNLSQDLIKLINRCIEVSNGDDLEEVVNEGRYRTSDVVPVVKSPKKAKKEDEVNSEQISFEEIGTRKRGLNKKVIEIVKIDADEEFNVDLMAILEKDAKYLYDNCVYCMSDGEFDDVSQESCIFCATQAMHQRMQLKNDSGKPSRSRVTALESIEKDLSAIIHRQKGVADKDEWQNLQKSWKETIGALHSLDGFWRSLLIVMLEKMNRVRELRQCTLRSEKNERMADEERKLMRAEVVLEKGVHNLKYVYSLREESGLTPSSSVSVPSTDPSSRECPICFDVIGEAWFVFPCAHLTCGPCFNQLIKLQGATRISCSVCRSVFAQVSVMYVSNKKKNNLCPVDSLNLSVKLDKIVRLTVSIMKKSHDEKMLVFTSLTLGLTALKSVFNKANLPFVSFEADPQRNAVALSKFRNDPQTKILLMKYESGGKGLNLTVANHIIFADTVDDASLEKQAIGRCDRIGQRKDVHLHYILAQDTMDERMYKLTREVTSTAYIQDDNWTVGTLIDLFTEV